ncbi:MAG: hypothetical protein L6E13_02065 [Firmicutes bacterium]|nr:hypothetical protein [Bacillota bacterium]
MAKFRKVRVVRRVRDALPGDGYKTWAERELEAAKEAKFEEDPYLNKGCLGCTGATTLFFGVLFLALFLQRCNP